MDRGTDALAILNNEVIPLKHGYIPVVNRSQGDINENKDLTSQWASEEKWKKYIFVLFFVRRSREFLTLISNSLLLHLTEQRRITPKIRRHHRIDPQLAFLLES